jgi:hypothetical protein
MTSAAGLTWNCRATAWVVQTRCPYPHILQEASTLVSNKEALAEALAGSSTRRSNACKKPVLVVGGGIASPVRSGLDAKW